MLRMQPFKTVFPTDVNGAIDALEEHGENAKICAGGTDLIPNIKHGVQEPSVLVHIGQITSLCHITETDTHIEIGAGTTLHQLASSPVIQKWVPGLATAADAVAGPQLRRMGTLGGNLCLDTRCLYYNQTYFWRESLGFCLKKDGSVCHVVEGGKRCVAAASNDTATMLLCLDTEIKIQNKSEQRWMPLADLYQANGAYNLTLEKGEMLCQVRVPKPALQIKRLEGFAKLRHRKSIDYPMLSIGVRFDLDADALIKKAHLIVNALAAKPRSIKISAWEGKTLNSTTIEEIAAIAHKRANPLTNICDDTQWRKDMVSVYVKRAIHNAMET